MSILLAFLFGILPFSYDYPIDNSEEKLPNTITEVTVYTQSARITRITDQVKVTKENSIFVLDKLSPFIDQNSVQVKLKGGGIINSVKFRRNYITDNQVKDKVQSLQQTQLAMTDSILDIDLRLKTLEAKEDFLKTNKSIKGDQAVLTLQQLKEVDQYYADQHYQIYKDRQSLHTKRARLVLDQRASMNQMNELAPRGEDVPFDLIVNVSPKGSGSVTIEVTYQVTAAGWYTTYDMRASDINSPVQLVQKANVYQNTGVDWTDVALSFSNENIEYSKTIPELTPMYLPPRAQPRQASGRVISNIHGYIYDMDKVPLIGANVVIEGTSLGTVTNIDGYYELDVPPNYGVIEVSYIGYQSKKIQAVQAKTDVYLQESSQMLDEVVVAGRPSRNISKLATSAVGISAKGSLDKESYIYINGVKVKAEYESALPSSKLEESQLNFKFSLEDPYTILSDGKNNEIGLRSVEMDADFAYRAIPKLSSSVYLTAYVDDWEDKNLTIGNMNLYFEGGYIGQSLLNPKQLQDSIVLSLGVDSKIQIERSRKSLFTKKVGLGTKKSTSVVYETVIKNQKSTAIEVEIWDQIPISTLKEIEVTKGEISKGFDVQETRGIGQWKAKVKPRGEESLKIGYTVKYPRKFNFVL